MPSFETHLSKGKRLGGIAGLMFGMGAFAGGLTLETSVIIGICTFFLVVFGSVLPDIDHHASIPRRSLGASATAVAIMLIFATLIVGSSTLTEQIDSVTNIELWENSDQLAFIAGLGLLLIAITKIENLVGKLGKIFDSLLTHRGFTHSLLFPLIAGTVVFILSKPILLNVASLPPEALYTIPRIFAFATFIGVSQHLTDDGII